MLKLNFSVKNGRGGVGLLKFRITLNMVLYSRHLCWNLAFPPNTLKEQMQYKYKSDVMKNSPPSKIERQVDFFKNAEHWNFSAGVLKYSR